MTPYDSDDGCGVGLSGLTALKPDPDRAQRFRETCRTQLGQMRPDARAIALGEFTRRVLLPAIGAVFCALYFALLVAMTLRFEGVL